MTDQEATPNGEWHGGPTGFAPKPEWWDEAGRETTPEQHAKAREWWKHLPTDERVALWQASEGREATCLCRGHAHNVLPGGDDCFQCHCTTPPGREATCAGCGNDLAGDNLCMVSACQWEGTEGREATPCWHSQVTRDDEDGPWTCVECGEPFAPIAGRKAAPLRCHLCGMDWPRGTKSCPVCHPPTCREATPEPECRCTEQGHPVTDFGVMHAFDCPWIEWFRSTGGGMGDPDA